MTRRMNRRSRPHTEIARVTMALNDRAASRLMIALQLERSRFPPRRPKSTRRWSMRDLESPPLPATAEDQRAMADTLDFLEIGRDQQHRQPSAQRQLQQVIDVRFRADVHADCRLLENEQLHMRLHPAP